MSSKVILEEGISVNVHTRIKDMCKEARSRMGLTNQDISGLISQRFGIEDFSVNTVNNFFSERSKASTIYTTGYICAVLNISIDAVFGIDRNFTTEEEAEYVKQLSEIKTELRMKEQRIEYLEESVKEKNDRIEQAHQALDHYRKESAANQKRIQPWIFIATLALLICALAFIAVYLVMFDYGNPHYGIFRMGFSTGGSVQPEPASISIFLKSIFLF